MATTSGHDITYSLNGTDFIVTNAVLATIATATVALRFWARRLMRMRPGLDDFLALTCLILHHLSYIFGIVAVTGGGMGSTEVSVIATKGAGAIVLCLKLVIATDFTYGLSTPIIKLAVLSFLWRVFPTRAMRTGYYILGSMSIGWGVAVVIATGLQCTPIAKFWDTTLPGHCIDYMALYEYAGVFNCIIDVMTIMLPIREVVCLQMSTGRKLALCGVFALGLLSLAASLLRVITVHLLRISFVDFTKQFTLTATAAIVEVYVAIIAACLPTIMPTYRQLRYGSPGSKSKDRPTNSEGHGTTPGMSNSVNVRRDLEGGQNYVVTSAQHWRTEAYKPEDEIPLNHIHVKKDIEWTLSSWQQSSYSS